MSYNFSDKLSKFAQYVKSYVKNNLLICACGGKITHHILAPLYFLVNRRPYSKLIVLSNNGRKLVLLQPLFFFFLEGDKRRRKKPDMYIKKGGRERRAGAHAGVISPIV